MFAAGTESMTHEMTSGMNIRRLILFAAAVLSFLACETGTSFAQDGEWGHLTGKILVDGAVPEPAELTLGTNDRDYCISTGEKFQDRSLLVGPDSGLQHAYVMMYFERGEENRPAIHPSYEESVANAVALDNVNCRFEPRAVFVRTGQSIEFKNSDPIGHNCHVVTMGNEENVSLGAGQELTVSLDTADRVPGIVKCDVHPWMEALILVRDEPYAAITDESGSFRIENIPAGEWTFQFWHKRPGFLRELQRDGQSVVGRRGELAVTIRAGETTDLGELTINADELAEK
jgi:plastocyanin